eukprot:PhM_4_TR17404/c0_g1_i15/m.69814
MLRRHLSSYVRVSPALSTTRTFNSSAFASRTSMPSSHPSLPCSGSLYHFQLRRGHFGPDSSGAEDASKYSLIPSKENIGLLMQHMWPPHRPDIKVRVATAITLMMSTKILTVVVPLVFKAIVATCFSTVYDRQAPVLRWSATWLMWTSGQSGSMRRGRPPIPYKGTVTLLLVWPSTIVTLAYPSGSAATRR